MNRIDEAQFVASLHDVTSMFEDMRAELRRCPDAELTLETTTTVDLLTGRRVRPRLHSARITLKLPKPLVTGLRPEAV